jgi:hypothetical protein
MRVPKTLSKFDQYLRTVIAYLNLIIPPSIQKTWQRLGLTTTENDDAGAYLDQWTKPDQTGAYDLHSNPETKNKSTRLKVVNIMEGFSAFFGPLLVRMSGSANITSDDQLVLNIAPTNPSRRRPKEKIKDTVYLDAKALGEGDVRFTSRTTKDSKRASRPKGTTAVEVAYSMAVTPPLNAEDGTTFISSTHAAFTYSFGAANSGKKLYVFARWINAKYPELAGPWCNMITVNSI